MHFDSMTAICSYVKSEIFHLTEASQQLTVTLSKEGGHLPILIWITGSNNQTATDRRDSLAY